MPSPSKTALFTGLFATTLIFIGGAYAATFLAEPVTDTQRDYPVDEYMPSLSPGGHDGTSQVLSVETNDAAKHSMSESVSGILTVHIDNVRNGDGTVYVLVFDDENSFKSYDYKKAVGIAELEASTRRLTTRFPNLSKGPYAVVMFHDEDGNRDLTMDNQGYPVEGYGTSNAKTRYDELSFSEASVKAGEIKTQMFYLQ